MRATLIAMIALVLAGCQTTGRDYGASSSQRIVGVCGDIPITSSAEVMPLRDENCVVTTPSAEFFGKRYAAKFTDRDLNWSVFVSFTETGRGTYMKALPFWDAMNGMWNPVREEARNKTGVKEARLDGLPVQTARFEMPRGDLSCMGFLSFGNYKGGGYDKRLDGYVCTSKSDDEKWFHEVISSLNLDELLT
jgi:hypothetical protein